MVSISELAPWLQHRGEGINGEHYRIMLLWEGVNCTEGKRDSCSKEHRSVACLDPNVEIKIETTVDMMAALEQ